MDMSTAWATWRCWSAGEDGRPGKLGRVVERRRWPSLMRSSLQQLEGVQDGPNRVERRLLDAGRDAVDEGIMPLAMRPVRLLPGDPEQRVPERRSVRNIAGAHPTVAGAQESLGLHPGELGDAV